MAMSLPFLIAGALGLVIGAGLVYAFYASRCAGLAAQAEGLRDRLAESEQARVASEAQNREAREGLVRAETQRQATETNLRELREEKEKLAVRLQADLRAMTQEMVTEGTRRLALDNRTQVGSELRPILDRMEAFRKRVDEVHTAETSMQSDLRRELQQIQLLNTQLGTETHALTHALKNDSGVRGRWGEMILEKTLEISGLAKGREYRTQESADRQRMDAVV